MKCLKYLLILVCYLSLNNCAMEPPHTYYSFLIKNNSHQRLGIIYKTIDDEETYFDTIDLGRTFYKRILTLQRHEDYGGGTISKFFNKLEINVVDGKLGFDLYNVSRWIINTDSLRGPKKQSGTCCYILTITDMDITMH